MIGLTASARPTNNQLKLQCCAPMQGCLDPTVSGTSRRRSSSSRGNTAEPVAPRAGLTLAGRRPLMRRLGPRLLLLAPARSLEQPRELFKMGTEGLTRVQFTGTGPGAGFIEREAPLIAQADILVYAHGRSGTLGELAAGMHAPKVIALLEGSGGVTDS